MSCFRKIILKSCLVENSHMNCRMNLAESHLKEDDLSILGRMMLYIFQKKIILTSVFFQTSISKHACFDALAVLSHIHIGSGRLRGSRCVQKGVVRRWMVVGRGCH